MSCCLQTHTHTHTKTHFLQHLEAYESEVFIYANLGMNGKGMSISICLSLILT